MWCLTNHCMLCQVHFLYLLWLKPIAICSLAWRWQEIWIIVIRHSSCCKKIQLSWWISIFKKKLWVFCFLFFFAFNCSWCLGMWEQEWAQQEVRQFPQHDNSCPVLCAEKVEWFLPLKVLLTPSSVLGPLPGFTWQTFSCVLLSDSEKCTRIHFLHLSKSYEVSYCLPFRIVAPGHTFAVKCKWWKSGSAQVCGWIMAEMGYKELYLSGERHIHAHQKVGFVTLITAALY